MTTRFIFEDNEEMPSSKLLLQCFHGDNIIFSNGNTLLWSKVMELYNENDQFFIFMDTVVDNKMVMELYRKLYAKIRKYKNIYLVPIPCIEFILAKCFVKYDYIGEVSIELQQMLEVLVKDFRWNELSKEIKRKGNIRYTERAYKYIITCLKSCLKNEVSVNNPLVGKFYLSDCDCQGEKHCGECLKLKAERLYTQLPYYEVDSEQYKLLLEKYDLPVEVISLEMLHNRCRRLFQKICTELRAAQIPLAILKE